MTGFALKVVLLAFMMDADGKLLDTKVEEQPSFEACRQIAPRTLYQQLPNGHWLVQSCIIMQGA